MISDDKIRRMTPAQRNMLVDHIDGPMVLSIHYLTQVRTSLMKVGLLRGHPVSAVRPKETVLTEAGRRAVAMLLGDYADALIQAGWIERESPLLVLRRLKSARTGEMPRFRPETGTALKTR